MLDFKYRANGFLDKSFCDVIINSYESLEVSDLSKDISLLETVNHLNQITLEKLVFYVKRNRSLRIFEEFNSTAEALRYVHQAAYSYGGVKLEKPLSCKAISPAPRFIFQEIRGPFVTKVDEEFFKSNRHYKDPGSSIEFVVYLGGDDGFIEFENSGDKVKMEIGDLIIFPAVWTHDYAIHSQGESYFLINTIAFDHSKYTIRDF